MKFLVMTGAILRGLISFATSLAILAALIMGLLTAYNYLTTGIIGL